MNLISILCHCFVISLLLLRAMKGKILSTRYKSLDRRCCISQISPYDVIEKKTDMALCVELCVLGVEKSVIKKKTIVMCQEKTALLPSSFITLSLVLFSHLYTLFII